MSIRKVSCRKNRVKGVKASDPFMISPVDLDGFGIKGQVAGREIREALGWIKSNQTDLLNEWRKNNP